MSEYRVKVSDKTVVRVVTRDGAQDASDNAFIGCGFSMLLGVALIAYVGLHALGMI